MVNRPESPRRVRRGARVLRALLELPEVQQAQRALGAEIQPERVRPADVCDRLERVAGADGG